MRAYQVAHIIESLADEISKNYAHGEGVLADMRCQKIGVQERIREAWQEIARQLKPESADVSELKSNQDLLSQLKQSIQTTRDELKRSQTEQQALQARHQQINEKIDQLLAGRDKLLEETPETQALFQRIALQQQEIDTVTRARSELEQEVQIKLPEYTQSRLFMFLLNKKFAQDAYRPGLIIRHLDRWLARVTGFNDNFAHYQMLNALLPAAQQRLDAAHTSREALAAEYRRWTELLEDRLELPAFYQNRKACAEKLAAGRQHIANLQNQLSRYAQGKGHLFESIAQRLSDQMAKMSCDRLELLVRKTGSAQDNQQLENVQLLTLDGLEIDYQICAQETRSAQTRRQATRMERLIEAFYRSGYDDPDLEYLWQHATDPQDLANRYLSGSEDLEETLFQLSVNSRRPSGAAVSSASHSLPHGSAFSSAPSANGDSFRIGERC